MMVEANSIAALRDEVEPSRRPPQTEEGFTADLDSWCTSVVCV